MTVTLGYTIVYVPDVTAAVRFYSDAFGLEQRFVTPEGDYGELQTGPTTLAFVAESLASSNLDDAGGFAPLEAAGPPGAFSITMTTEDVADQVATAVAAGATPYVAPTEKPWGQTVAYVRDPNGLLVEIATPMGG